MSLSLTDRRRLAEGASRRIGQAFRPGTRANQHTHVLLYVAFAFHFALQDFPAEVTTLILFAEFLARSYRAPKSVTNALSSVRAFHLRHGFAVDAFEHRRTQLFRRALPLTLRHAPDPAAPLPLATLTQLCGLAHARGAFGRLLAALFSALFFSMARVSSLLPQRGTPFDSTRFPTLADLRETSAGFSLRIKWGKTCQAVRDEYWVPLLPLSGSLACPVSNLRAWLALRGGEPEGAPLFALPAGPQGPSPQLPLTLPVAKAWLALLLGLTRAPRSKLTFHSFRRGACTLAFKKGASLSDIKQLGGWRSDAVASYYPAFDARGRAAARLVA